MLLLILRPLLLCSLVLADLGPPGGDLSCHPTFPPAEGQQEGGRQVLLAQAGYPAWQAPGQSLRLLPSIPHVYNLTTPDLGEICSSLNTSLTEGWCEERLPSLAGTLRVLGLGYSNGSEVCAGMRQLVVRMTASSASSSWGECLYDCGQTMAFPYIRYLLQGDMVPHLLQVGLELPGRHVDQQQPAAHSLRHRHQQLLQPRFWRGCLGSPPARCFNVIWTDWLKQTD